MSLRKNEKDLPHDLGSVCWRIFRHYSTVRICRDLLQQYVFERPVIVEGAANTIGDADLDWASLGKDIMDYAMAVGIAVVKVRQGEVPTVIPWSCCRVTIETDSNFKRTLRAYPTRDGDGDMDKPIPNSVVLDIFGFSPTDTGELTSLMQVMHTKIYTIMDQLECAIQADRSRCAPPIFTETHDDQAKPAEEVQYDYYADCASLERNSANVFARNQNAIRELHAQKEMFKGLFSNGNQSSVEARDKAMDSVTPLPIGARMSRAPVPEAPEALVDRMRFLEQDVFVLLGVPRSFCMHDITVRHDAGMLHCTFTRTVHMWQNCVGSALTKLHALASKTRMASLLGKRKRSASAVDKFAKQNSTRFVFEKMPRVGVMELSYAYDRGIITWGGYKRLITTFAGLNDGEVTTGKEPWSKEDRLLGWTMQRPKSEFTGGKDGQSNRNA